tara:strand:+ start:4090 stop:4899 length:810 start_codon:yes stop_codon:yes gene_type:complete
MGFFANEAHAQRTKNFPKKSEYVEKMPHKDSLWVFIMAGQSNMAGRGLVQPQDTIPNKRIVTIDSLGKWMYAKEPLNFNEPTMKGLDCGLSFANEMLRAIPNGISIGLIPCAVGNTPIEQWLGDSICRHVPLLTNFKSKVAQSKKYGEIKGILWHQGEANAKTERIPFYAENLRKLTKTFRDITGNDALPILIGQLGSYAEPMEWQHKWDSINNIIRDVAETDINTYVIYTQDLESKSDKIHFDSKSQRTLGKRYADTYLEEVTAMAKK